MRSPTFLAGLVAGVLLLTVPGCLIEDRPTPPVKPQVEAGPTPNTLGKWDDDIATAQTDEKAAGSDQLKRLEAEKREADARAHKSEDEARQWHQLSTTMTTQIKVEHDRIEQVRLYWVAGIFLLLAIAAAVVAIWQPMVRKLAGGFAVACGAGAALCVFVAWLVPYLIWIGCGMTVIGIGAALIWWKRDSKALGQTVEAVGAAKTLVPEFQNAYKSIFNGVIDTDAEAHITNVRSLVAARLAKEKTRLAAAVHKMAVKV